MRYTIDAEFDGHGGPLISLAIVPENGSSAYYFYTHHQPKDPWVVENVMPFVNADHVPLDVRWDQDNQNWAGAYVRDYLMFLQKDEHPVIIADSPVDIARFCQIISTGPDGTWRSTSFPRMTFEVHNVDCWPNNIEGAIQHNAYWDAVALGAKLREVKGYYIV